MILFILGALIGYMVFFAIYIAPITNKILDEKNKTLFLRTIFPKNFIFGLFLSGILIAISLYHKVKL